jgi:hypothetical protein
MSFVIKSLLKNFSDIPGSVINWKFDVYKGATLLAVVDKDNFDSLACGQQQLIDDSPIVDMGRFEVYGFTPFSVFGEGPDTVRVTVTIKDDAGNTYEISDQF